MRKISNKDRILNCFLEQPTRGFGLRELERLTGLGLPSVRNYVLELQKENLIKPKKIQRIKLFYANREGRNYKRIKVFYNISRIYDSGLIDFINRELSYPTIVLFGSAARGEDSEDSDIDLYIESAEREIETVKFEKKLGKIQVLMHRNIKDIRNRHLANNIINGIVLEGFLEVFR